MVTDIQMKATRQSFPVILFIMLFKVVLTFEFLDEMLMVDPSNKSYQAALSFSAVYYAVQRRSKSMWNLLNSQIKATEHSFPVILFIMLFKVVLTFKFVDEMLKDDHSNERFQAVLSFGAVYYAVQARSKIKSDLLLKFRLLPPR